MMDLPFPKLGDIVGRTNLFSAVLIWIGLMLFVIGLTVWLANSARGPILICDGLALVSFGFLCDQASHIDGGSISYGAGPTQHFINWPYVWRTAVMLIPTLAFGYLAARSLLPILF